MSVEIPEDTVFLFKEETLESLRMDVIRIMTIHEIIRTRWPRYARALFQGDRIMRRVKRRLKDGDIVEINGLLQEMCVITQSVIQRQRVVSTQYPNLVDPTHIGLQKYYKIIGRISSYIETQRMYGLMSVCMLVIGVTQNDIGIHLAGFSFKLMWFSFGFGIAMMFYVAVRKLFRKDVLKAVIENIVSLSERNPAVCVTFIGWVTYDSSREASLIRSLLINPVLLFRSSS